MHVSTLRLRFTCTADENGAGQGHAGSLACVDPHRQRLYQSPLLKSYIIRQPGSLKIRQKKQKNESKSSNDTSDSCWATWGSKTSTDKLLLVAEVGVVFVVSAKVSIIRGCGTEEDGGR